MKKIVIGCLIFVLGASLFAQTNNDAQRIVGNWKHTETARSGGTNVVVTITVTFAADGTYTIINPRPGLLMSAARFDGQYMISNSKLILNQAGSIYMIDYYFSDDNKILAFSVDIKRGAFWLVKQ